MPTPNWNLPNDLTLAAPNNPPADINALANAVETALDIEKAARLEADTPVTANVPMVGVWNGSTLTVTKIGKLVILAGTITKNNGDTIPQGTTSNIGVIGVNYRPKAVTYLTATGIIVGSSVEYRPYAVVNISLSGNVSITATSVLTRSTISAVYVAA